MGAVNPAVKSPLAPLHAREDDSQPAKHIISEQKNSAVRNVSQQTNTDDDASVSTYGDDEPTFSSNQNAIDVLALEHANSVPPANEVTEDTDVKQPMSAPVLVQRRSVARASHTKRRISGNVPNPTSHFSKPIEMPPQATIARIETEVVPGNRATLQRVQSGNNTDLVNKLSGSKDRDGKGGALKKQITKISKIAAGKHARKKVKDGEVVFKGHRNWEIVLSIQFGLRYTSELLEDADGTEPTAKDYEESLAFDFNPVDDRSVFEVNKFAKWVHPAPFVYKRIRDKFGVSEKDFLEATCSESRVRELPTPGKSGALFYITDDENYFMKTIQHIEEKMLISMLPSYYDHIAKNPNTLLTKYMAHFSVQTQRDRHIRMVVMASIFNEQVFIDRKYDLKGSTYKRFASPEQLQSENVTLKDQDFDSPVFFPPEVLERIMSQLSRDSAFLERHNVMDYSLLLGVSDMIPEESALFKEAYGESEEDAPYFVGFQVDRTGRKSGVRVCMGIIDFLQRFRLRKKMEYGARVMQSCSSSAASVAPPHLYRERFMAFLESRFLPDAILEEQALTSADDQSSFVPVQHQEERAEEEE